jgi:hypothetical protein
MAYFEIVVGDSSYKSTELDCKKGAKQMGTALGVSVPVGAKPKKFDPIERAREQYSRRLEEGDVVEEASYPEAPGPRPVRVVRDGKVVATIAYGRWGGYEEGYCQGQF